MPNIESTVGTSTVNPTPTAASLRSRTLLACGVAAGPIFLVAALTQAATRTGFDLRRHPFSMLSLGDLGWIQVTNFVFTGALFTACAVGMRQVLHPGPGGTWGPVTVGLFGLSQIAGGLFVADPALGFPIGSAEAMADSVSWHAHVHAGAFALGMTSLIAATCVLGRYFAVTGQRAFAFYTATSGVCFVALGAVGATVNDWRIVAGAVVVGWVWVSLAAAKIRTRVGSAVRA